MEVDTPSKQHKSWTNWETKLRLRKTQDKQLSPRLKEQTGKYKELLLTRAENHQQRLLKNKCLEKKTRTAINQLLGAQCWQFWELNYRRTQSQGGEVGRDTILWDLSPKAHQITTIIWQKSPHAPSWRRGKKNHLKILKELCFLQGLLPPGEAN